jgi:hypothetical protein
MLIAPRHSFHVSDHDLDGGAATKLTFDEAEDAALLTGDEDAARIGRVVAAVAVVDIIRGRPALDRYSGTGTAGPRNRTFDSLSGHRIGGMAEGIAIRG